MRSIKEWPAESVEKRAVASLVPYARNARTHSEAQVKQIAASIGEFGWTVPALIDEDGGLIAGHGRVLAAKLLGIEEVPVMVARGWTEAQKRAYVIADNKLALDAGWDLDLLKVELEELSASGFNTDLTGFLPSDIEALYGEQEAGGVGAVPDGKYAEQYGVIAICKDEASQKETYEALVALGYTARVVTT